MKKANVFLIVLFFLITGMTQAQNIAISDVSHTADASAVLDVYSTSLGMLVPRLASAPASPANGLLYYSTGSNSFYYNAGTSATPSWAELSHGNLWSRTGTDTYLTNMGDNVVIGTGSSAPGYKFYVFGPISQMSRFDGQVEFWDVAGGTMSADVNSTTGNGVFSVYNAASSARVRFKSLGSSFLTGGAFGIGTVTPTSLLHIYDAIGIGNPQLTIENPSGGGFASQSFIGTGVGAYSEGQVLADNTYVLNNTATLAAGGQSDGATMMKAYPSGIIDLDNQSRARAFQDQNPNLPPGMGQIIPYGIWTPVDYEILSYDEQSEFILRPAGTPNSVGGGSAKAFFIATEEGYYDVNARTNFLLVDPEAYEAIWAPFPDGFASIGIVVTDVAGTISMYAQGNKLQGADNNGAWGQECNALKNNLAPNVSDVVYLKKGETIEIWVWQDLWTAGLPLEVGPRTDPGFAAPVPKRSQTYVSIHKSS